MSAQSHQLSLSLRPGGQRTGVPCVQFLSAFQIIANEPNAPFHLYHYTVNTAICRQLEVEFCGDLYCLYLFCFPQKVLSFTEQGSRSLSQKITKCIAPPIALLTLFCFPSLTEGSGCRSGCRGCRSCPSCRGKTQGKT